MTHIGHMSQQYIITSAEVKSLSTDKIQIGLKVQKINIRVHNQQATGCCLGASLLRNEVVVRELNEGNSGRRPVSCRTCNIGPTVADKGGKKTKEGESRA